MSSELFKMELWITCVLYIAQPERAKFLTPCFRVVDGMGDYGMEAAENEEG
jgi:hypothetical protein